MQPKLNKLTKAFCLLKNTPLHPQWFSFRDELHLHSLCSEHARGLTIDIGCADKKLKKNLSKECHYYGLDYLNTAAELYKTDPDIFGDAQILPFKDESIDTVALIEVLEHIPNPNKAVAEISRILKPEGKLIITTPFLYPIHDAPYDFHRWTKYALENLTSQNQLKIIEINFRGTPSETGALLSNIAATKTALTLLSKYNPLGLLLVLILPIFIPMTNILGVFFALFERKDDFMPFGYRAVYKKVEK